MLSPKKIFALLGAGRTESPEALLFNRAFAAWGIPATLRDVPANEKNLADVLAGLRRSGFSGAAIAPSLQLEIIPLLDKLSPVAQRAGAVDTLYWEGPHLVGHNTLADALALPLYQQKINPPALILSEGDGGPMARNALSGLLCFPQLTEIFLCAPGREKAEQILAVTLAAEIDEHAPYKIGPAVQKTWLPPSALEKIQPRLLVNCAASGAYNPDRQFDIPAQLYQEKGLAYDVHFGETEFLLAAKTHGWDILDGLTMFLSSAKEQFILWTGMPLPEIAEREISAYLAGNKA